MRRKLLKIFVAILFLPICAQATTIDFNDHQIGTIQAGDNYNYVTLLDFAVVTMVGGEVGGLGSWDSSIFNLQSGSVVNMQLWDSTVAHISGGSITGTLGLNPSGIDQPTAHVYGKNLNFIFDGGATGWLTGNWADNTPFSIYCRSASASYLSSHLILHIIPEPCTFGLIGFGFFIVRRAIKTFHK